MFFIVICYIRNDATRGKVGNILRNYGVKVQNSVFECFLEKKKIEEMSQSLLPLLGDEDELRIYPLCESCKKKIIYHGQKGLTDNPDTYII